MIFVYRIWMLFSFPSLSQRQLNRANNSNSLSELIMWHKLLNHVKLEAPSSQFPTYDKRLESFLSDKKRIEGQLVKRSQSKKYFSYRILIHCIVNNFRIPYRKALWFSGLWWPIIIHKFLSFQTCNRFPKLCKYCVSIVIRKQIDAENASSFRNG